MISSHTGKESWTTANITSSNQSVLMRSMMLLEKKMELSGALVADNGSTNNQSSHYLLIRSHGSPSSAPSIS